MIKMGFFYKLLNEDYNKLIYDDKNQFHVLKQVYYKLWLCKTIFFHRWNW